LPGGSFPPNGHGLFDMAGNAWDWGAHWYDPDYYHDSPRINPPGPASGTTRVRRGGDWARSALSLRCACRSNMPPDSRDHRMAFRVVLAGHAATGFFLAPGSTDG
jgi:formylglycine-generating enzyme required for sulfatase activity